MNYYANTANGAGSATGKELPTNDVVEVSLFLSRQQISQLAQQAQSRGLTSAQFLRQYISSLCQGMSEKA